MAMEKTNSEQWKQIAEQVNKAREELLKLSRLLSGDVPKTVHRSSFRKSLKELDRLKSELEERFAKEHPEQFDTEIFYPGQERDDS